MKPFTAFLLLGTLGMWGQTIQDCNDPKVKPGPCIVKNCHDSDTKDGVCRMTIDSLGNVFTPTTSQDTVFFVDVPLTDVGSMCERRVSFHGKSKAIKDIFPSECGVTFHATTADPPQTTWVPIHFDTPESPDVPAISEDYPACDWQRTSYGDFKCEHVIGYRPTCADKDRILLTSESGKHWCHKVEPSPSPK